MERFSEAQLQIDPLLNNGFSTYGTVYRFGNIVTLLIHDAEPKTDTVGVQTKICDVPYGFKPISGTMLENPTQAADGRSIRASVDSNTVYFTNRGTGYIPKTQHTISFTYATGDSIFILN